MKEVLCLLEILGVHVGEFPHHSRVKAASQFVGSALFLHQIRVISALWCLLPVCLFFVQSFYSFFVFTFFVCDACCCISTLLLVDSDLFADPLFVFDVLLLFSFLLFMLRLPLYFER